MSQLTNIDEIESQALGLLEAIRALKAQASEVASVIVTAPAVPAQPANDASFAFDDIGRFYDFLRGNKLLGPKISESEYQGCESILLACTRANWPVSFTAYAMATAYLETAHTMQPIKELGGAAYFTRMYDIQGARPAKAKELGNLSPGDGAKYCGRGYVQLTGKNNYAKATSRLHDFGIDVDLVANPELALRPDVAAAVMVMGMRDGWFTGRKLSDDLPLKGPAGLSQFTASRDIINGHDRQADVASYANDFQTGLQHGGYKIAA